MNLCEPLSIRLLSISCHTLVAVSQEGVAAVIWLLNIGQIYIRWIVLPEKNSSDLMSLDTVCECVNLSHLFSFEHLLSQPTFGWLVCVSVCVYV